MSHHFFGTKARKERMSVASFSQAATRVVHYYFAPINLRILTMSYAASLAAFFDPRSKYSMQRKRQVPLNGTIGTTILSIETRGVPE